MDLFTTKVKTQNILGADQRQVGMFPARHMHISRGENNGLNKNNRSWTNIDHGIMSLI